MVVKDGQRIGTLSLNFHGALEVQLPQIVGPGAFKSLQCLQAFGRIVQTGMTLQDGVDGSRRRQWNFATSQKGMNLGGAPMVTVSYRENLFDQTLGCLVGRVSWPAGLVSQGLVGLLAEALDPLMASLSGDAELSASLTDCGSLVQDTMNKGDTLFRHGNDSFPGHAGLLPYAALQEGDQHPTSVTYVPSQSVTHVPSACTGVAMPPNAVNGSTTPSGVSGT